MWILLPNAPCLIVTDDAPLEEAVDEGLLEAVAAPVDELGRVIFAREEGVVVELSSVSG